MRLFFLFDMDGTIVDNMDYHLIAWREFLKSHGIEMTDEELHYKMRGTIEEGVRRNLGEHLSDEEVAALGFQKEQMYRDLYAPHLKLIDGLEDFLQTARKQNIKIALVTAANIHNVNFTLDGLNIRTYFDTIVTGDDVKNGKPDPEGFLIAAERFGAKASECIVFEDSIHGIRAADAAQMRTMLIGDLVKNDEMKGFPFLLKKIYDYKNIQIEEDFK
jgi:beta-phosphoglucomutase